MSLEQSNNFENTTNNTENNSEFLESIKNDIKSLPQELQNLWQKEKVWFTFGYKSTNTSSKK